MIDMPHKLVTYKNHYRVRSWVTGKLLKRKYPKTKAGLRDAKATISKSYNRSNRVRSTRSRRARSKRKYSR